VSLSQKLRLQPWRLMHEALRTERESWKTEGTSELARLFLSLAKRRMLTPADVMAGSHILFAKDVDFYANLLARRPAGLQRVQAHNFMVADALGPAFLIACGDILENLEFPLFPPAPEFMGLNQELLDKARAPSGGSTTSSFAATMYRHDPSGGEFFVPVAQHGNGYAVNLTPVEEAFKAMQQDVAALKRAHQQSKPNGRRDGGHRDNDRREGDRARTPYPNRSNSATFDRRRNNSKPRGAGEPREEPSPLNC
jgi:hypothetical protein